jgi:hypothetical protein
MLHGPKQFPGMHVQHAIHEFIAVHNFEKSYYFKFIEQWRWRAAADYP